MKSLVALADRLPRLHLYVVKVVFLLLVIQSILRIVFYFKFYNPADPIPINDLVWSFYLGIKFDLQASLGSMLPVFLLGWFKPIHPVYSKLGKKIWFIYGCLVLLALFTFYLVDFGHYAYLETRLNGTALRFLDNPVISATMVWQTYPIISGGIIVAILFYICVRLLQRLTNSIEAKEIKPSTWHKKTGVVFLTFIVVFAGLVAKFSWYPLRWSDAFFSTHAYSAQLSSNPVIYFSNTLKNTFETFDIERAKQAYPIIAEFLEIDNPDSETLNYKRKVTFDNSATRTPTNVVIVFLESFASYKSGFSGSPLGSSPNLEKIASEGYFFKNFYVTQTGTARSVWTLITGMADIEKVKTSSRNPMIVDQYTIANAYKGYKKFYFLGGSASWANIRGLLSSNIPNLELFEEGSYQSPRIDVWGISDLSLFEEAHNVLKDVKGPFFAVIQTSGNHRPYTIPEDNRGFKVLTKADLKHDVTDYGFASIEELNSFRFMDHSIGFFIKEAKKAAYFENTVFAFFADHGIHAKTGKHVRKSEEQLRISGLRVPLVIYGPGIIKEPKVFDEVASQVDVLPTLTSIARVDYVNTTLGRDLLDKRFDNSRYAFTIEHLRGRVIGLLSDKYYFQMEEDGSKPRLHDLFSEQPRDDVSVEHAEITNKLAKLTQAMWDTIFYMRENNRSEDANR